MKLSAYLSRCLLGITSTLAVVLSSSIVSALTPEEIDAVASQTTVVIGNGLAKGQIESGEDARGFNTGSGVIIGRQDNIYYVLTALHVVNGKNQDYRIRTWDGEVYPARDRHTKKPNILKLGSFKIGQPIKGLDLAIIKFQSNKEYHIASVKSSEYLKPEDALFASGWPEPEDDSAYRVRVFKDGLLSLIASEPFFDGGYSLLYTNQTSPGMSGGPVFDQDGWVVGIHGRGKAEQGTYCVDPQLSINNNCGMQMIHFLTTAEAEYLRNRTILNQEPVDPSTIADGMENKERADVIENIYEDFTVDFVESGIRSYPSGTCWSLLLGDNFCCNQ